MGLLGNGWDDPQSSAIMALSGGLLQGNFGAGLVGANNAYAQAKEDAFKRQYAQAQMADMEAQRQQRLAAAQKEQAALLRQQQIQAGIPGLFQAPGMTGGAPQPQSEGGVPMFSRPMGVAPMQSTPGGFDVQGAIRLGMDPKMIAEYAALQNIGRQKVARTVKGMGPDGREFEYQVDEFGGKVGEGMPQYRAPISVNQGNRTTFADPYSMKPVGAFQTYQSPDSAASNAVAIRGQNMTDARARSTAELGTIPSGYRRGMNGTLEFIPGGPADPNTPKSKANLTEDQGKATGWLVQAENAWKNMQKVGMDKDGNITEAAKPGFNDALAAIPSLGFTTGAANMFRGVDRQKYMQASSSLSEALLRAATGAGVNKEEAAQKIREITPVVGDGDDLIKQKMAAIPLYLESLRVRAGPGAAKADAISSSADSTSGLPDKNAIAAELERRKGLKR